MPNGATESKQNLYQTSRKNVLPNEPQASRIKGSYGATIKLRDWQRSQAANLGHMHALNTEPTIESKKQPKHPPQI